MAIYLDHASTTPLDPKIASLISESMRQAWANPASLHAAGRRAKAALEDARDRIKQTCLGDRAAHYQEWNSWQLVLTSGGTEANNLALHGLADSGATLIVGATEHPSILAPTQMSPALSPRARLLPIDPGTLTPNIDVLDQWLADAARRKQTALVSVMVGNNETGIMCDIAAISRICRSYGARLHTDAVQAFGKCDVASILPLVDALTLSAHKLNGPVGVGALLFRSQLSLAPMLFGGGQQLELRPGTESVVQALAMAAAVSAAEEFRLAGGADLLGVQRNLFEEMLQKELPWIQIHGRAVPRLPHISSVAFPGHDRQALLMKFDLAGLECSSGSACASGSSQPSHVLVAMQLPPEWISGTIRFSFGRETGAEEIAAAVRIVRNAFP